MSEDIKFPVKLSWSIELTATNPTEFDAVAKTLKSIEEVSNTLQLQDEAENSRSLNCEIVSEVVVSVNQKSTQEWVVMPGVPHGVLKLCHYTQDVISQNWECDNGRKFSCKKLGPWVLTDCSF